jgi:hypothetical protein
MRSSTATLPPGERAFKRPTVGTWSLQREQTQPTNPRGWRRVQLVQRQALRIGVTQWRPGLRVSPCRLRPQASARLACGDLVVPQSSHGAGVTASDAEQPRHRRAPTGVEQHHVTNRRADQPALHPLRHRHPRAGAARLAMRGGCRAKISACELRTGQPPAGDGDVPVTSRDSPYGRNRTEARCGVGTRSQRNATGRGLCDSLRGHQGQLHRQLLSRTWHSMATARLLLVDQGGRQPDIEFASGFVA